MSTFCETSEEGTVEDGTVSFHNARNDYQYNSLGRRQEEDGSKRIGETHSLFA
jgi:hypothetical protein